MTKNNIKLLEKAYILIFLFTQKKTFFSLFKTSNKTNKFIKALISKQKKTIKYFEFLISLYLSCSNYIYNFLTKYI